MPGYGKFYQTLGEALLRYAEHRFRQGRKLTDGGTVADHSKSAARIIKNIPGWKGPKAEDIAGGREPPFPRRLAYLWSAFNEFAWGLTSSGMGPPMASWRDVQDFCDVQGLAFAAWEKTLLVKLATLRGSILSEQSAEKIKNGAQGQNRSG